MRLRPGAPPRRRTELLHGSSIADALLDHAAHNGVSTLVGPHPRTAAGAMFNRTLTQQLIQRGAHYESPSSARRARARSRREGCCRRCAASAEPVLALIATALAGGGWLAERWVGWPTCRWCSSSRWCWWPRARVPAWR
jgi:two-component system sensor histidine kinase KdpD